MHTTSSTATLATGRRSSASPVVSTTARLRILHVVNRLDLGGTESGILKIVSGLGESEFAHAICTARGHSAAFASQHRLDGRLFDASGPDAQHRFLVRCFARIIRAYRPHIVHSRNWGAIEAVFAARLAGVPVVIHSEHGYELDMLAGLPLRRRLMRRAAYALADAVFTVSADLRAYHARQAWVSPSRIRLLANGVDSARFAPPNIAKSAARARLGLPADTFLAGSVGRLVPIKGHAALLDAAEMVMRRGVDLSIALVGDGSELERLRARAAASPHLSQRVHFLGASKNVPDALQALDAFVLPSISEGMSNTLLEAMSVGLPVVVTRVGGNSELVADHSTGLLVPVGNTSELAAQLETLALNPQLRRDLGSAARARILTEYRLDLMLDRYRNLYKELAARRGISVLQTA